MTVDIVTLLTSAMMIFLIGMWGIFLNRKNIIIIVMSIELMLLAVNYNFIIFSVYLDDLLGQLFALLVLTVAAAESAIGLAILVVFYRRKGQISIKSLSLLRG
jgi:NADH-quinone oxidoreductase subunit K